MPLSWAKAFLPTMALLNCTGNPLTEATRRDIAISLRESTPVVNGRMSARTLRAITTSSSAVLPARSPNPLMVHSICRAPPSTAANALAVAIPRSLWQCVAKMTPPAPGISAIRRRMSAADSLGAV